jgi:hypothetical protein
MGLDSVILDHDSNTTKRCNDRADNSSSTFQFIECLIDFDLISKEMKSISQHCNSI